MPNPGSADAPRDMLAGLAQAAGLGPKLHYTTAEAARLTGVHPDTVKAWIRSGRLGAMRYGPTTRVPHTSLLAFLEDAYTLGGAR